MDALTCKDCYAQVIRNTERIKALGDSAAKAEDILNIRLEGMNEFRDQINKERATYVSKVELDLRLKNIENNRRYYGDRNTRNTHWLVTTIVASFAGIASVIAMILSLAFR